MRVLFDIGHPAHVHFFRQPISILKKHGHEVMVTSRDKEFALDLLDELEIKHIPLSSLGSGGLVNLAKELIVRNYALYKITREYKPDIMAAIGGVSIAQVGKLTGIPNLVFYDTENAKLQNAITYPFASCVIVPRCYQSWVPKRRHIRYAGYHELSYLHPGYFSPDLSTAIKNGLSAEDDTFFIRLVSWQANHDVGETGWNQYLLNELINKLTPLGKILISSETPLPAKLQKFAYQGNLADVHHVMAYCRLFIGESATMASECAVLGIPAIYAAETGRGYTDEQEKKYCLVKNLRKLDWKLLNTSVDDMLKVTTSEYKERNQRLLNDTIDVSRFIVNCIETYPAPLHHYLESRGH